MPVFQFLINISTLKIEIRFGKAQKQNQTVRKPNQIFCTTKGSSIKGFAIKAKVFRGS